MSDPVKTEGERIGFGKFAGEYWTRVPVPYLKWMVQAEHSHARFAEAELARRGTSPEGNGIHISGHAIDRFSLRRLNLWHEYRQEEEGIHAFLIRVSLEALETVEPRREKYHHLGMTLAIDTSMAEPILKTVL